MLIFKRKIMEEKKIYTLEEASYEIDKSIHEQSRILKKNLKNNKIIDYV